jgi:hypothetical protein
MLEKMGHRRSAPDGGSFSLRAALCLPSSCNSTDFESIASQLVPILDPNTLLTVTVNPSECYTHDTVLPDLDAGSIAAIAGFGLLIGDFIGT